LIVDRYGKGLVFQTLALGIDKWKEQIAQTLVSTLSPDFIIERNDARVRLLEGLPLIKQLVYGQLPAELTLTNPHIKWQPDLIDGPHTGVYWEQFWLGRAILPFASGARVLDTFCHTGITGLHAAAEGALRVHGVDQDLQALKHAERHAALNGA